MFNMLEERAARGEVIRVALVGAGRMGLGIARQLRRVPGIALCAIADIDPAAAEAAAAAYGAAHVMIGPEEPLPPAGTVVATTDGVSLFGRRRGLAVDVVVESTNTIGFAAQLCEAAVTAGADVVLMNAEVDLALGVSLRRMARAHGRIISSDAGDQHGVLARMIDEIRLWGLDIAMAGNIKGFLDRRATARSLAHEANIRKLNPVQCCAYTDGTKLNIEMALVANGTGLVPAVAGMQGPPLADVHRVFDVFDFSRYREQGIVDYVLGTAPGGGVFVVGHCDDPLQREFLEYYKMGTGPFYLFYRPYHLCSLETCYAIARLACRRESILEPRHGRLADVYAYAKREIAAGEPIPVGIGGDHCYGMIDRCATADARGHVPIAMLEPDSDGVAHARRPIAIDRPVTFEDIELPPGVLTARCLAEIGRPSVT